MTVVTISASGTGSITVGGGGANDPPNGVTSIQLECWGSGSSSLASAGAETGGASGAYGRRNAQAVSNGTTLYYRIPAGIGPGGSQPFDCVVTTDAGLSAIVCSAGCAVGSSGGSAQPASNDVAFAGADGVAAQGGGGSRGGSGGSSSAGPSGAGVSGAAGSGASGGAGAAGSGSDVGAGGNGAPGATVVNGADGGIPGGGAGGGGTGSPSDGGTGANGQVRFTWTAPSLDTLLGQACL